MNGRLMLQDGSGNTVPVNGNGNFTFPAAVSAGASYNVTIDTQPANPAQTCGVMNGGGTVESDVTNITVDCGHNEWTWMSGSATLNLQSTYGTMGVAAPGNGPGGRFFLSHWLDANGNFWLFGGYGDGTGGQGNLNDFWMYEP